MVWHLSGTHAPAQLPTGLVLALRHCVFVRRYQEFKAALQGLDPRHQSASPLPIIYQWAAPIAGAGTKCALLVCHAIISLTRLPTAHHPQVAGVDSSHRECMNPVLQHSRRALLDSSHAKLIKPPLCQHAK